MTETPESIALLRAYFEAHQAAMQAVSGTRFAECMAAANRAAAALMAMPRQKYAA